MGDPQKADLLHLFHDEGDFTFEDSIVIWESTESEEDDNASNAYLWVELAAKFDVVCGIFPPSALVALWLARDEADDGNEDFKRVRNLRVFTPISEVTSKFGEKKFRYLRMQEL